MQSVRRAFRGRCPCRWHYYLLDYCYVVHATLLVSHKHSRYLVTGLRSTGMES